MTFLEKLKRYGASISMTVYRFDKISNFLTFEQYVDEQVKKYAKSLIEQPITNSVYERENKNVSFYEIELMAVENCYDSISILTEDGKALGVPPTSFITWQNDNNYSNGSIKSMELKKRGWL